MAVAATALAPTHTADPHRVTVTVVVPRGGKWLARYGVQRSE